MQIMAADREFGSYFLLAILSTLTILSTGQTSCFITYTVGPYTDSAPSFLIAWTVDSTQPTCAPNTYRADTVIVSYALTQRDKCQDEEQPLQFTEVSEHIGVNHIIIEGLVPYSIYTVSVSLRYNGGVAQIYPDTMEQTDGTKPGIPINVRTTSITATTATFEWDAPPCGYRGNEITKYFIQISKSEESQTTRTDAENRSYRFHDLDPCTEYVFTVKSEILIQLTSDPVSKTITTSGVSEPYNLKAPDADLTSITVEWEPPNLCDGSLQVQNYTIEYGIDGEGYDSVVAGGSYTRYRLQNLTSHVTYNIRLSATGKDGMQSSWTPVIKKTTEEGVSSEPLDVTATKVTTNSITLKWNSPLNPNGVITNYKIIYSTQTEDNSTETTTTTLKHRDLTNLMTNLKNLEPTTTYEITIGANKESEELDGNQTDISVTTKDPSSLVAIAGGATGGVIVVIIIIVAVLVILCKVRRKRRSVPQSSNENQMNANYQHPMNVTSTDVLPLGEYENLRAGQTDPLAWDIQWENIRIHNKILGEGSFGIVQEGEVKIGSSWITVAVKTLPDGADAAEVKSFENELGIMKKIGRHINIVSLIGACKYGDMLYVALEHVSLGNLKTFLKDSRTTVNEYVGANQTTTVSNLTQAQLINLALDVANGMEYLAEQEIIHRDLAARNILVGQGYDGYVGKVCDFGMSRGDGVYRQQSNARVPVKWTAIEALTRQLFTTKSDVWSFGILLWEIVTLGGTPYTNPKIENRDLALYLQNSYRLDKPENCDEKMYDLMFRCWAGRPSDRPTFTQIVRELTYMLEDESLYVITAIEGGMDNFRFVSIDPDDI